MCVKKSEALSSSFDEQYCVIQAGDTVEFSIIYNTRNGKQSACKISVVR